MSLAWQWDWKRKKNTLEFSITFSFCIHVLVNGVISEKFYIPFSISNTFCENMKKFSFRSIILVRKTIFDVGIRDNHCNNKKKRYNKKTRNNNYYFSRVPFDYLIMTTWFIMSFACVRKWISISHILFCSV